MVENMVGCKQKALPTRGAGPPEVMLATIHMLNGIIFTIPHISATFRANFSILHAIQAELLLEN